MLSVFIYIIDSIISKPIYLIIVVPFFLLIFATWILHLYHWHKQQKITEDKMTLENKEFHKKSEREDEMNKMDSEKYQVQIEIAKKIVDQINSNSLPYDISIGSNPILGDNFHAKPFQEDDCETPSNIVDINGRFFHKK